MRCHIKMSSMASFAMRHHDIRKMKLYGVVISDFMALMAHQDRLVFVHLHKYDEVVVLLFL